MEIISIPPDSPQYKTVTRVKRPPKTDYYYRSLFELISNLKEGDNRKKFENLFNNNEVLRKSDINKNDLLSYNTTPYLGILPLFEINSFHRGIIKPSSCAIKLFNCDTHKEMDLYLKRNMMAYIPQIFSIIYFLYMINGKFLESFAQLKEEYYSNQYYKEWIIKYESENKMTFIPVYDVINATLEFYKLYLLHSYIDYIDHIVKWLINMNLLKLNTNLEDLNIIDYNISPIIELIKFNRKNVDKFLLKFLRTYEVKMT